MAAATTAAMPRPWNVIPVHDCGEDLIDLPPALLRLEPHPYRALGAPYGSEEGPFRLRQGVVERLLQAQERLQQKELNLRLAIFDAWRPVTVQRFMVQHAYAEECRARGLDPDLPGLGQEAVRTEVGRFWAPPSTDPAAPPPHSTGAAVDLTLADAAGRPLAMGGEIDAIGAVSEPDHWVTAAMEAPDSEAASWHRRRCLLAEVMAAAGFVRHPHEWWHFSWGDQLWAWRSGAEVARYGRLPA
jgi:D-alanyl-D-alanine dipeptidase